MSIRACSRKVRKSAIALSRVVILASSSSCCLLIWRNLAVNWVCLLLSCSIWFSKSSSSKSTTSLSWLILFNCSVKLSICKLLLLISISWAFTFLSKSPRTWFNSWTLCWINTRSCSFWLISDCICSIFREIVSVSKGIGFASPLSLNFRFSGIISVCFSTDKIGSFALMIIPEILSPGERSR